MARRPGKLLAEMDKIGGFYKIDFADETIKIIEYFGVFSDGAANSKARKVGAQFELLENR